MQQVSSDTAIYPRIGSLSFVLLIFSLSFVFFILFFLFLFKIDLLIVSGHLSSPFAFTITKSRPYVKILEAIKAPAIKLFRQVGPLTCAASVVVTLFLSRG